MNNVPEELRRLRLNRKWKIADVAEKLGFASASSYQKLEAGTTPITIEKLVQLAEVFEVSVGELLGLEGAVDPQQIEELKTRITELEDRLRDKERIIRLFESRKG